ncbi:glycosyltransferase [Paenibacillus sp. GYB003]|uniref:glycosyltransferase n=1 Tax=Paenibacillus sp. GYB003 TaxID=2994392 RepID=UPI002F969296
MNILLEGAFYSGHGLAEGNRILLRILERAGHAVRIRPIDKKWMKQQVLSPEETDYLRAFEQTPLPTRDLFLCNWIGSEVRHNPEFRVNIVRTTFETDRIPQSWVGELNKFDEVWVQCSFNRHTFSRSGVTVPIRLIPNFFDESQFRPEGDKMPLNVGKSFLFLSVFDLKERKGYDVLLRAFLNEFSGRDDAALIIKVRSGKYVSKLHDIVRAHPKPRRERPLVHVIDRMFNGSDLIRLYRSCDCFVLPSRGEGWGRPFFEAMLMEMPVIGTAWSGQTEFMNEGNSFPVKVERLVEVKNKPELAGHYWAEPSVTDLQRNMRYVFENRDAARAVGKKARAELLSAYSMEETSRKVTAELDKFR